jgi:hypothetical protein
MRSFEAGNGELKETFNTLRDGIDCGYFTHDQVLPLQRLSKRASKACTSLIAYLQTAEASRSEVATEKSAQRITEGSAEPQEPKEPREPFERNP